MNRRGKRLTLGVMAMGFAVVIGLGVAHRKAVLDHLEAWHVQLTRKTQTLEPNTQHGPLVIQSNARCFCSIIANYSGQPVILAAEEDALWGQINFPGTFEAEGEISLAAKRILETSGYRVLEQRFPRRAYVVIQEAYLDPQMLQDTSSWSSAPVDPQEIQRRRGQVAK